MRYVQFLLACLLVLGTADALFQNTSPQMYVDRYNSNIDQAPQALRELLGSERVEINILLNNGTLYMFGLETFKGRIVASYPGGIDDPTITIETSESTIQKVVSSNDPVAAFKDAKDKGEVKIEATRLTTRLKLALVLASADVFKYFLGVFFGQR